MSSAAGVSAVACGPLAAVNSNYGTSDPHEIRELEAEQARKQRGHAALVRRLEGKAVAHASMKALTVETLFCIVQSGTVRLTGSQAKLRLHNIKALDVDPDTHAGVYAIVAPIQFKRGEHVIYEGKALMRDKVVF